MPLRDMAVFDRLIRDVVSPQIKELIKEEGVSCSSESEARDRMWAAYRGFYKHCVINYMQDKDGSIPSSDTELELDRHKVAACYMYAVLVSQPLQIDEDKASDSSLLANERLAVSLGCSVLQMYDRSALQHLKNSGGYVEDVDEPFDRSHYLELDNRIDGDIKFEELYPAECKGYYASLIRCLRAAYLERRFDVLALALLTYHWERDKLGQGFHKYIIKARAVL